MLFFCLLLPTLCRAQDAPINYARKSVWRVLFLTPGVTNESRLGSRTTLVSSFVAGGGFVATGTNTTSSKSGFHSSYYVNSAVSAGVRQFYNFERRLERGKSTRYNSGNYLMVNTSYVFPPFVQRNDSRIQLVAYQGPSIQALWGFQRTYRRNFYLNLTLGVGASLKRAGLTGGFNIGYTFPGSK